MGLHADPRSPQESRAPCWPLDDRPDSHEARTAAGAGAADLVADFLRAHWGAIAGADFFTTEVWTWRGLVTFCTVFAIDRRRVLIVGSTSHPDDLFMRQVGRTLTATDGLLSEAGVHVVQTPFQAPNANVYAERLIGSIRRECLDHVIVVNEIGLSRILKQDLAYYPRQPE